MAGRLKSESRLLCMTSTYLEPSNGAIGFSKIEAGGGGEALEIQISVGQSAKGSGEIVVAMGEHILAEKYLKMVGLTDRMDHTSSQLSGGQMQRVAIARSLVMNPAIILADEPTGNIASSQAEEIMAIFQKLNKEGHTILMITHEPDIAAMCKRNVILNDGIIIKDKKIIQQRAKSYV